MIDLTNAPEGATHYVITGISKKLQFMKNITEKSYDWYNSDGRWVSGDRALYIKNCKPIIDWSIYNNTLPLGELSDEQRGLLFNHWFNGGSIETESSSGWVVIDHPQLMFTSVYRAKQKSERELFIEAAVDCYREDCGHSEDQIACIAYMMFDSGNFTRKAPKVGE